MNDCVLLNWKRLGGVLLAIALASAVSYYFHVTEWRRCYARVSGGMTIDQVRSAMGRDEDMPDNRRTTTGEFELSWSFEEDIRLTVVFDRKGLSKYIEFAPSDCGVTPLMGKYDAK